MSDDGWQEDTVVAAVSAQNQPSTFNKNNSINRNYNTTGNNNRQNNNWRNNDRSNDTPSYNRDRGSNGRTQSSYNRGNENATQQSYYRGSNNNDRKWQNNQTRQHDNGNNREWRHTSKNQETNNRYNRNDDSSSITFEVLPNKVGKIIGKGGSTIKEIQSTYNVAIKIDQESRADGMSVVLIRGKEKENMESAKKHIEELITDQFNLFSLNSDNQEDNNRCSPQQEVQQIDWAAIARQSEEDNILRWANCPTMIKNFYNEDPFVANMSAADITEFRVLNNNISVARTFQKDDDMNIPNPVLKFEHCFSEYPDLLDEIRKQGFEKPSPIQCQAWPILLKGEDLIGIAQTGTGKTLAFLLPAMIHTEYQPQPRSERTGANVLVFAPTRELALQIDKEVKKYQFRGMKSVCVYGGGNRREQMETVGKGVEIIIATPGRLNDLVQAKSIDLNSITYLVLDEADRMLDMGFEAEIRKVLLSIRPDRQTVMTSATWPPGVRNLAEKYMNNPIQVCIGSLDLAAVQSVEQIIEIIDEENKFKRIMSFISEMNSTDKIIIFCGKKARADDLSSDISLRNIATQCIHGDRDQADREQALEDIKSGEVNILIATDVASRGIDIEDISHVINYDFPRNIEEYVHRVGRTGRAGRTGIAISLLTREDWGSAPELIKILEKTDQVVPDELREMKNRFEHMKERREQERQQFGVGNKRGRGGGGFRGEGGGGGGGRRY